MTGKTSTAFNTKEVGRNLHTPAHRLEGESHQEYRERRRIFNRKQRDYLKGIMVRPGSSIVPMKNPKTGKIIKNSKGEAKKMRVNHKPFTGRIKSLIKGQA